MSYSFSRVSRVRSAVQWGLVLWAAALVFYFQVREGLIRWAWLFEPASGGFFKEKGLPDPRFAMPAAAESPVAPYVMILKNAMGPYDIQWANAPWKELLIATGMIGGYIVLGLMFLSGFRIFLPRLARVCVALVVGTMAVGIGGELLGMAHRLTQGPVAALWGGLLAAGAAVALRNWMRRDTLQDFSAHTRLTPREQSSLARNWYESSAPWPLEPGGKILAGFYVFFFALITLLVTLHAVGQPVVYWDSLILYVGYARAIFLEGGFPVKVVGQVGVGLGANYPHLYEILTAQTAALSGYWSDSFAQLLPPVATAAAMVLVYYTVVELTRERLVGLAAALTVRAVPYGLSYSQFASNYSLAILFTAAFVYMAVKLVRDGLTGYRTLMLLIAAGAVHINYLMWGLWPVAVVAIVAASQFGRGRPVMAPERKRPTDDEDGLAFHDEHFSATWDGLDLGAPEPMAVTTRPRLRDLLKSKSFWAAWIAAAVVACPWYVRNVVVTGNPVYAFYSNIFPSVNVNPDVMKSAEQEWLLNGDGLGRVGRTLGEKLANSWLYFVTGNQHWKLAPFFMGFVVPGFLVWIGWWMASIIGRRRISALEPSPGFFRAYLAPAALFLLLWFYAYVVADFYLYQIIIVLPLFGLFVGCLFAWCRGRAARIVLHSLVLLTAFVPGVVMGLMGFKLKNTGVYEGMPSPQMSVTGLRRLFMPAPVYYRMEYGGDMEMFGRVNMLDEGTVILTHENRALLLKPELKIVHLDDWEVQQAYGKPAPDRMRILDELGVRYYLYVPNEDRHVANSWLQMEELIKAGYFRKEYETPSADGFSAGKHEVIPAGKNVLYERTDL